MAMHSVVMVESPKLSLGRSLRTGPSMFDTPTPLRFRSSPLDVPSNLVDSHTQNRYKHESKLGIEGISHDFREALKIPPSDKSAMRPDSRNERISDAFHRGETLLLSNDNARPKSRCKTSLSIHDLQKTPTSDIETTSQKSTKHLHRYISNNTMTKIFGDGCSPTSGAEKKNNTNNAHNESLKNALKKEKKQRKRAKSHVKTKKSKGRISIPSTGLQSSLDKHSSAPSIGAPSKSNTTRQRVSSEPPSKLSLSSVLSCAPHTLNNSHTVSKLYPSSACNPISRDKLSSAPSKRTSSNFTQNVIISYTLGNAGAGSGSTPSQTLSDALQAQAKPITIHKPEQSNRVKSGHSATSSSTMPEDVENKEAVKETASATQCELFSLSAKSCNIHTTQKQTLSANSKRRGSNSSISAEQQTREAALTAIYGAVYQTANHVATQIEDIKKARKIFLSDRQSGTLKENGVEYPCAPPATPNPDLMRKYDFVPSMSDIRSQRTVKTRLQVMERDAQKKREKQKETQARLDKQMLKEREKTLKVKQRREIYALNKVMTELENKKFMEFCQAKGLNKV